MNDPIKLHQEESISRARLQALDPIMKKSKIEFFNQSHKLQYSYNFEWLGRPIIQYPQDIVAFQEIVNNVKPDLILETGIAHGGSLVLSASLLCMLDVIEGKDPRKSTRKVLGIDVDIREHNREALDNHPLRFKMELMEGSSIDEKIVSKVKAYAKPYEKILVSLDSNHTHSHVLDELNAYAELVSKDSYCIVYDTVIEDMPTDAFPNRDWGVGNSPKSAVYEFIKDHPEFEIDKAIDEKLLISVAPDGFLKKIK